MATQTYSFTNGFSGGMNIAVSPDQIAPNQSPSMENCNFDGGAIPSKRFGYSKLTEIILNPTPIRTIAEFKTNGEVELLVVCGGALFKKN